MHVRELQSHDFRERLERRKHCVRGNASICLGHETRDQFVFVKQWISQIRFTPEMI